MMHYAIHLFVCSSVCLFVRLSPKCVRKNAKFSLKKTNHFRAVVSVDDKYEVLHGLYTEPIERRQTSPRASQQTPMKNFTAVKFMVAAGA